MDDLEFIAYRVIELIYLALAVYYYRKTKGSAASKLLMVTSIVYLIRVYNAFFIEFTWSLRAICGIVGIAYNLLLLYSLYLVYKNAIRNHESIAQ